MLSYLKLNLMEDSICKIKNKYVSINTFMCHQSHEKAKQMLSFFKDDVTTLT